MVKKYKAIVETYKYDVVYESEEFDETKEVLGVFSSKEEARKKIQKWFDGLVREIEQEGCVEGEDYRIEQNETGCWLWDYTQSDGEGYVQKYCGYVE